MGKCDFYDINNNKINDIEDWENLHANIVLEFKGKWESKDKCGLSINVTALQIIGKAEN